jgi:predicted transcriptional regulator of viral defense system
MPPTGSMPARALALVQRRGAVRLRDAVEHGIHPEVLRRLVAAGELVRPVRGVYELPDRDLTEHADLAQAAMLIPLGVICLLSALTYHHIGTQMPHEVWMMIPRRAHRPRIQRPPMHFVTASGPSLTEGVETVTIEGQAVRIFSPAKTVVDCFRYRRHVGLDVAIEALREALRERRCTPDAVVQCATKCGVVSVVRPYLEAIA